MKLQYDFNIRTHTRGNTERYLCTRVRFKYQMTGDIILRSDKDIYYKFYL